jgi:hypothetical protein
LISICEIFYGCRSVFLNRRDASQYRDLKTFSPGLGTLDKLKIYLKLQRNQAFLRIKSLEKHITRTKDKKIILPGLGPEKVKNH